MLRVLSVSYDSTLVRTRELLLSRAGYRVESALGFRKAMEACSRPLDLVILGVVIPMKEKLEIIECFRTANPSGVVLAVRSGERQLKQVDGYVNGGDPEALLEAIKYLLPRNGKQRRAKANGGRN